MSEERVVRFKDEEFKATYPVPPMALAEFVSIAQAGTDSNEVEGLVAMYDLLESVIEPEDWARFKRHAKKTRASGEDLMTLVRKVITGQTERPTLRPSDSSDGPESTEPSSEPDSSSPDDLHLRVVRRMEAEGRPDKALMVQMAAEQQKATSAA